MCWSLNDLFHTKNTCKEAPQSAGAVHCKLNQVFFDDQHVHFSPTKLKIFRFSSKNQQVIMLIAGVVGSAETCVLHSSLSQTNQIPHSWYGHDTSMCIFQ